MKTAPAKKPTTIDEYIKAAPKDARDALKHVRQAIREVAPDAQEKISYQMPAFKLHGRILVYFAAHTHHIGLYPAPVEAFAKEFAKYETSKGTVRFPLDKPMPLPLIKKVVRHMAKEVEAKAKAKK
ncbi:MAG: DUF1801 domain-containing protein [Chloroflexi bacterium]|nr:DUF1801 domain-containing protein [Chloroflexota bacterium]